MIIGALRFYDVAVFIHIAAAIIAFGVTFAYPLIIPFTQKSDPRQLPYLHRMQALIGQRLITPAATLVLLAGLYLALSGDGPFHLKDWWVGFGLVVIVLLLGLANAFFAPREKRAAAIAERDIAAAGEGPVTMSAEYETLGKQVAGVGAAASLLILVTVLLMVLGTRGVFS